MILPDLFDHGLYGVGDTLARSFGGRSCTSVPAAQTNRPGQLRHQRIDLNLYLFCAIDFAEPLNLLKLFPKFTEPPSVLRFRSFVEELSCVAETADTHSLKGEHFIAMRQRGPGASRNVIRLVVGAWNSSDQIENMKLCAGKSQQVGNVVQPPAVLQPENLAVEADPPELAVLGKDSVMYTDSSRLSLSI